MRISHRTLEEAQYDMSLHALRKFWTTRLSTADGSCQSAKFTYSKRRSFSVQIG